MEVLNSNTKGFFEDGFHSKKDLPTFEELVSFVKDQFKVALIVQAPQVGKYNCIPSHSNVNIKCYVLINQVVSFMFYVWFV